MSRVGAQPFKPFFDTEPNREHPKSVFIERPTYRQLKKELPALMKEYGQDKVTVFRSRRGEWGEWFEKWELLPSGKLVKTNSGWM